MNMKVKEDPVGRRMHRLLESRKVWKQRVSEKQAMIRFLRVKVRDLEVSRELWKTRATTTTKVTTRKVTTSSSANSVELEPLIDEVTAGE